MTTTSLPSLARIPAAPARGRRPANSAILFMTLRASASETSTWLLPVIAFAIISTIILDVTAGAVMMWHLPGDLASMYKVLSSIAVILLVLPLATLAASAARLSARRRDDRLSALRLVGASSHLLRSLTLAEAGLQALAGALLGLLGHAACLPALARLSFNGSTVGLRPLLLGPLPMLGVIAALVLLALISSAVGLRRVEISPLGVQMRTSAHRVSWLGIVVGVILLVVVACSRFLVQVAGGLGTIAVSVVGLGIIAIVIELANIVGPKMLEAYYHGRLRKSRSAVALVAARQVLENPRAAWSQVASLGAVSVVGLMGGAGAALMQGVSGTSSANNRMDVILGQDIQTGVLLTILFSFATVACSVGVNQASAVLDRRRVEVGLDVIGMDLAAQDAVRRRTVLSPMRFAMGIALAASAIFIIPMTGIALINRPVTLLVTAATILVGAGMVRLGLWATRPTLRRVLDEGLARTE